MGLFKLASLEKKAFDPMSIMHGLIHGGAALGHMAGYVPHDWLQTAGNLGDKFLMAKAVGAGISGMSIGANLLGGEKMLLRPSKSATSRKMLADSLIALKRGSEGQALAGRSPLGLFAWSNPEMHAKLMAMNQVNKIGFKTQGIHKVLFDGNKLNPEILKNTLESSGDIKDAIQGNLEARAARSFGLQFARLRRGGMSQEEAALKAGRFSAKLSSRLQNKVQPTIENLNLAHEYHGLLSANNNAGYGHLTNAAKDAETVLNRPKYLNYSKLMYRTPKENYDSVGKYVARGTQFAFGQKPKEVGVGRFLQHGFGEVHAPIERPPQIEAGKFREMLQAKMPHQTLPETITPEHIKNVTLNLPSMREDLANSVKQKTTEWGSKIFGSDFKPGIAPAIAPQPGLFARTINKAKDDAVKAKSNVAQKIENIKFKMMPKEQRAKILDQRKAEQMLRFGKRKDLPE